MSRLSSQNWGTSEKKRGATVVAHVTSTCRYRRYPRFFLNERKRKMCYSMYVSQVLVVGRRNKRSGIQRVGAYCKPHFCAAPSRVVCVKQATTSGQYDPDQPELNRDRLYQGPRALVPEMASTGKSSHDRRGADSKNFLRSQRLRSSIFHPNHDFEGIRSRKRANISMLYCSPKTAIVVKLSY